MSIKVGVLRGGPSSEHEISLKTGKNVILNLAHLSKKYSVKDIILNKEGDWFMDRKISQPERIFRSIDVVFNALHGYFGEDGKVQKTLETYGVPYTGSGVIASALGMNKVLSRGIFKKAGLNVPKSFVAENNDSTGNIAKNILKTMPPSFVVKPATGGSSLGVSIAHNFNELVRAIETAFNFVRQPAGKIIIEEYIKGREATCGIIDNFRGEKYYSLPVIEIIPPKNCGFFDYKAKYSYDTQELCPANFDLEIKKQIEEMAKNAHHSLGCRDYSRADFIVARKPLTKETKIYLLEINTLPGLTTTSLLLKAINAVGSSYSELLDHLLTLALSRKHYKF